MDHFKQNGYHVTGSGKMMHHRKPGEWSEYEYKPDYGPMVYDGENRVAHTKLVRNNGSGLAAGPQYAEPTDPVP